MKNSVCIQILTLVLSLSLLPLWAETEILFDQNSYNGETAITSSIDSSAGIDYEVADNFWDLQEDITKIEFYGLTLSLEDDWEEQVPNDSEPFIYKFYQYEEMETSSLIAETTGSYKIALYDSYGDGWNGGRVSVFVNGEAVLSQIYLWWGTGPRISSFEVNAGDAISTVYTPGDWSNENYYQILDTNDNLIAEDGGTFANMDSATPSGISSGGIAVLEPEWENPLSVQQIDTTVEPTGTNWNGYEVYRFTANFATSISLTEGWVSAQIDSNNGSGTWFLWMSNQQGDLKSFQKVSNTQRTKNKKNLDITTLSQGIANRGAYEYDLAFSLWGADQVADLPEAVSNAWPQNNQTDLPIYGDLSWNASPLATGYKLYLGTEAGNWNLVNGSDLADATSYSYFALDYDTEYFWKLVPYNDFGEQTEVAIWNFSTETDPTITSFPHHERFDNVSTPELPVGWRSISSGIENLQWQTSSENSYSAPNALNFKYNNPAGLASGQAWLITPPLELVAGRSYDLSYYYRAYEAETAENMTFYWGTHPTIAELNTSLIQQTDFANTSYQQAQVTFVPENSGIYYFGWAVEANSEQAGVYLDEFEIRRTPGTGNGNATGGNSTAVDIEPIDLPGGNVTPGVTVTPPAEAEGFYIDVVVTDSAQNSGAPQAELSYRIDVIGNVSGLLVNFELDYSGYNDDPEYLYYWDGAGWSMADVVWDYTARTVEFDYQFPHSRSSSTESVLTKDGALPVTLSSFSAVELENRYVKLNWQVEAESHLQGYYIYRAPAESTELQKISPLIAAENLPHSNVYQFVDYEASAQASYDYYLESVDMDGSTILYEPIGFVFEDFGQDDNPALPEELYTLGNYPNPFNPSTTIRFSVPQDLANKPVKLQIFNARGQLIRTLVAENKTAGNHTILWDGRNAAGKIVSSGIFYSKLSIGQHLQQTAKLIMMK